MPTFTSSTSVSQHTSTHVAVSFDGINKAIAMYTGGLSGTNSFTSISSASDVHLDDSAFVLGSNYEGTMSNVELTYGVNSPTLIETYSFESDSGPLFGYRFDNYKTGTNDQFADSVSTYDLQVHSTTHGIKLSDNSYAKYVSSLNFAGDSYLESTESYSDSNQICLVFWVQEDSLGTVFHLNDQMTVSVTASNTIEVIFHRTSQKVTTTTTLANAEIHEEGIFKDDWVYVCINSDNQKIYFNPYNINPQSSPIPTTTSNVTVPQTTFDNIYIGGRSDADYFTGHLDAIFAVSGLDDVSVENSYDQFKNDASYSLPSSVLDANQIENNWTHIAASYDKDSHDLRIYHNGSLFTTYKNYIPNMNSQLIVENSNNMLIGKTNEATPIFFDGSMDDIRIYENPMNANDVKKVYAQYFEEGNDGEDALLDAQFDISISIGTTTTTSVTFSASTSGAPASLSWKAIAIADSELNSRQIINNIINNTSLTSAVYTASSAELTDVTISNVVTVKTSEPYLEYEVGDIERVNRYDVFVYASGSGNESVSRVDAAVDAATAYVPKATLASQSNLSIFASENSVLQYFVLANDTASPTVADVRASGSANSVNILKNQVKEYELPSYTGQYIHVVAVDSEDGSSEVASYP